MTSTREPPTHAGLTIGDLAERTGVAEGTLRMWERRHAFPSPTRSASGHRRYREGDVDLVRRVASERSGGVSLSQAIARATTDRAIPESVYATLRAGRPDLQAHPMRKALLVALARAIEDESLSRASRPLLFASFQRETAYREHEHRWRELSRGAALSVVFADFADVRLPDDGPVEVPVGRTDPLLREWTVVCFAADHAACLSAWERPGNADVDDEDRMFEAFWSVDADVVWRAAHICADIAAATAPEVIAPVRERLSRHPEPRPPEQLRLSTAVTTRLLSHLS